MSACPRCGAERIENATTCLECRWIFEDHGVVRDEVRGYPGEAVWRGFCYVLQGLGIATIFLLFYPHRPTATSGLRPYIGPRGHATALDVAAIVYILTGWGLRRKGPSRSTLLAVAVVGAQTVIAGVREGVIGALAVGVLTCIPFALCVFPDEIGESMGYIRLHGTAPGGEIAGKVVAFLGWGFLAFASWAILTG